MAHSKTLRIVLATQNAGKVRELADPLTEFGVEVLGLSSFPEIGDIEETAPHLKKMLSSKPGPWRP